MTGAYYPASIQCRATIGQPASCRLNNNDVSLEDIYWPAFRCLFGRRTRLSTIRALGVLMLWMIPYFFIEVYHYRRALYRTDLNVPKNERVQLSHYLNSSRDKSLAIDTLIEFWEREQVGEYKITNYKDLWEEVRAQHHGDTLFPETYDADKVLYALRRSKIIEADLFKKQTSLKFKLTLEGGQRAIFKVKLMESQNKTARSPCNQGCEHPEYEVVGFTLNRLFGLRNAPFASGRVISWHQELEAIAGELLRNITSVEEDGSVCFTWKCLYEERKQYCLQDGQIPGAVIYFLEDSEIENFIVDGHYYHGFHRFGVKNKEDLKRLPGDKTYCNKFRKDSPYDEDAWFLDIVDLAIFDFMMSHMDEKHAYYRPLKAEKPLFNLMFDFGHAFCPTNNLEALAPLLQCCRIRTRLYKAMMNLKYSLKDVFLHVTKKDPLHPLLLPEVLEDLNLKFGQALAFMELCTNLERESEVFIDL